MSIQKVTRRVDTVIIELDITTAEKLAEVMANVLDHTREAELMDFAGYDLATLNDRLAEEAGVRWPSPSFEATVRGGAVVIEDRS